VVTRPSDEWQRLVEEQAAELAAGTLSPDDAYAAVLWPESLRVSTSAALASFERELHALASPSDAEVLDIVQRLVVALNKIHGLHLRSGSISYETGERDELCDYIDASLEEAGIDVPALEARHGIESGEIAGQWRDW
jgi:hypothetical protein